MRDMPEDQRRALAQQLNANSLFHAMLNEIERAATERLITAETEQDRVEAQWRVRAARQFASDCKRAALEPKEKRALKV